MWFSISTRSVAPRVFLKRRALDEIAAQQRTTGNSARRTTSGSRLRSADRLAVVR